MDGHAKLHAAEDAHCSSDRCSFGVVMVVQTSKLGFRDIVPIRHASADRMSSDVVGGHDDINGEDTEGVVADSLDDRVVQPLADQSYRHWYMMT
jgi:hypothetical protein